MSIQRLSHDALCPFHARPDENCYQQDPGITLCDLIAKVRYDERAKREKFWQPDEWGRAYAQGAEAMRAACIAAVEALESLLDMDKGEGGYDCCGCSTPSALYDDAIAVLRDLRPSST
jgi:hypothetical protein